MGRACNFGLLLLVAVATGCADAVETPPPIPDAAETPDRWDGTLEPVGEVTYWLVSYASKGERVSVDVAPPQFPEGYVVIAAFRDEDGVYSWTASTSGDIGDGSNYSFYDEAAGDYMLMIVAHVGNSKLGRIEIRGSTEPVRLLSTGRAELSYYSIITDVNSPEEARVSERGVRREETGVGPGGLATGGRFSIESTHVATTRSLSYTSAQGEWVAGGGEWERRWSAFGEVQSERSLQPPGFGSGGLAISSGIGEATLTYTATGAGAPVRITYHHATIPLDGYEIEATFSRPLLSTPAR